MRYKDIQLLWGRVANRCSFPSCRIELSPVGDENTLGEMAHIVAKKQGGPRGDNKLPEEKRDNYSNLILLCPTHHTLIDKNANKWTVNALRKMKREHEDWVSSQLENNNIKLHTISNEEFLSVQKEGWPHLHKDSMWLTVYLTPLEIVEEIFDPLSSPILEYISSVRLPETVNLQHFSRHYTHPTEYGLVSEYLDDLKDGLGVSLRLFRNGHLELHICVEDSVKQITNAILEDYPEEFSKNRFLRFSHLASSIKFQIEVMKHIWENFLKLNDMAIGYFLSNTESTIMYSQEKRSWRPGDIGIGFEVHAPNIDYSTVCNVEMKSGFIIEALMNRMVQSYGLVFDEGLFDELGNFRRPDRLYE